jgi:single-strand DNA-binding protein
MEIVGRLTADAKVSTLKDKRQVVHFSIAINDTYKPKANGQPVKVTNYVNCSYWINPAIGEYLKKGSLVELSGRIGVNAWTNADGEAKASLTFHVNNLKLYGRTVAATKEKATDATGATDVTEPMEDLSF